MPGRIRNNISRFSEGSDILKEKNFSLNYVQTYYFIYDETICTLSLLIA